MALHGNHGAGDRAPRRGAIDFRLGRVPRFGTRANASYDGRKRVVTWFCIFAAVAGQHGCPIRFPGTFLEAAFDGVKTHSENMSCRRCGVQVAMVKARRKHRESKRIAQYRREERQPRRKTSYPRGAAYDQHSYRLAGRLGGLCGSVPGDHPARGFFPAGQSAADRKHTDAVA